MPHVNIYLNKEENERLKKLCDVEDCSRYAKAKQLVLEAMQSFEEKNDVRKPKVERGHESADGRDSRPEIRSVETEDSNLPPFLRA